MQVVLERIQAVFSPQRIGDWFASTIPQLVGAMLIFVAFYLVWRIAATTLTQILTRTGVDPTARSFTLAVVKGVLFTIAIVSALAQMGIDTSSLLTSLGVAGLTLGFAARDALSNMISGIFIFWDRPFVIGDLVEIGGSYGRVDKITMRSTRVVTVDGKMLAIPNSVIVNTTVTSYTNFPNLRIDVPLTVGLEEDYGRVTEIMLAVARQHPEFLDANPPRVVIKSVGDYNVEVELQVWIHDETKHIAVRYELRRLLYEALRRENVVMPLETLQLAPLEVRQA